MTDTKRDEPRAPDTVDRNTFCTEIAMRELALHQRGHPAAAEQQQDEKPVGRRADANEQ